MEIDDLTAAIRSFADDRDWQKFHTAKDLAISVAIEAGELLELVQWRTDDEIAAQIATNAGRLPFSEELADVAIYLMRLADVLGIDLSHAITSKLEANATRYPAAEVHGRADKRPTAQPGSE